MDIYTLKVKEIIDSEFAVSADRANKVYNLISNAIKEKKRINVSFKDIEVLITAFLNIIYGDLYRDFKEEEIENYVSFIDLTNDWEELIPLIKQRALEFYKKR
ncbi:MAG: STAS-like domain-containing protein [Alphaproteobacteria bacterium]|nr:STAS-like domain-containing protein [Alphaproteobacteria bacterium]